jgi:hypothetical protein
MERVMVHGRRFLASLILIAAVSTGCGSRLKNSLAGGAGGAIVGAGTGAIIGSIITNGDVPGSALAGGAVGLPVGLVLGLALSAYDDEVQEKDRFEEYKTNQYEIMRNERELEILRDELREDTPLGAPDRRLKERIHMGPSLGSYYR